jgi:hypothetical protein
MNEFVLVEFIFEDEYASEGAERVIALAGDFELSNSYIRYDTHDYKDYHIINGRLNAMTASALKLQDKFLSDRMYVSYISDELKDRYRT